MNECNLSCKIEQNGRIIGLNRAKKKKILSEVCMIKKQHVIVLFTWWKKVYFKKDWFTRHQICSQDLLVEKWCKLVEHKKSGLIFEDYSVFHKTIFRGCPIIHSLSNGVVWELWIKHVKLRWWVTGLFCLERICFRGLILCDRTWLLFLGVHIRLLTRC